MKLFIYKIIYYKVNFEKGWTYRRVECADLYILEAYHTAMAATGWERITDPVCGLFKVHYWCRKPYKK